MNSPDVPEVVNPAFPEVSPGAAVAIYEKRLVAYVDILGWKELVAKSVKDLKHLQTLTVAKNWLSFPAIAAAARRNFFTEHPGLAPHGVEATHFSDTVVFSCTTGSHASVSGDLVSQVQLTCMSLLLAGHYTRGAIVFDQLHHDKGVIFGPALIEAYQLEQ